MIELLQIAAILAQEPLEKRADQPLQRDGLEVDAPHRLLQRNGDALVVITQGDDEHQVLFDKQANAIPRVAVLRNLANGDDRKQRAIRNMHGGAKAPLRLFAFFQQPRSEADTLPKLAPELVKRHNARGQAGIVQLLRLDLVEGFREFIQHTLFSCDYWFDVDNIAFYTHGQYVFLWYTGIINYAEVHHASG